MKKIMLVIMTIMFMGCTINTKSLEDMRRERFEYAYMEGQIDALEGDIRVERDGNDWIWTESPWDDGRDTVFSRMSGYYDEFDLEVED